MRHTPPVAPAHQQPAETTPPAAPYTLEDFAVDLAELARAILTDHETDRSQAARRRMQDPAVVIDFHAPKAQSRATTPQE